jgi:hypothetical protein
MPAIDSVVAFSAISAWNEVTVSAQWLEPKDLFQNIWRDWNPALTTFREEIFFGSIHDADASITDPVDPRVHNLNVSKT